MAVRANYSLESSTTSIDMTRVPGAAEQIRDDRAAISIYAKMRKYASVNR
jgi:hypothetical protein